MKAKHFYLTGKCIFAKLLLNVIVWSSTYANFAAIWGFTYGLTVGIGDIIKRSHSALLIYSKRRKSHSHQRMGPERDFYEGRQSTKQTKRQPKIVVNLIKLNT